MHAGDVWTTPAQAPILVLGSGQRCGSTLVQRLVSSHPDVLVWGEHGGHLKDLLAVTAVIGQWDANVSGGARDEFRTLGTDSWIANLLPGQEAPREAARAYLLALFADPAAAEGRPRWGFKEVRFDYEHACGFRSLFGELVTIHVTRDPRDVLVSLDSWERDRGWWRREFTEAAIELWATVTASFLRAGPQSWVLSRRYEDIVAAPQAFVADVARLLQCDPGRLDASVFDRRVRDHAGAPAGRLRAFGDLPDDLRALVERDSVQAAALAAGYG